MKKVLYGFGMCSVFLSLMGMDNSNSQYIPLDDVAVCASIESYEGLQVLAKRMKSNEEIAEKYEIQPSALAEYVLRNKDRCVELGRCVGFYIAYYKQQDPATFNTIVQEVLQELTEEKDSYAALTQMHNEFEQVREQNMRQINVDITNALPEYNKKRSERTCAIIGNSLYGGFLLTGVTLIGLFSWVVDHCHHPWD